MSQRQSTIAKSVFYRGISLKEYLRKSTENYKQMQFKDEQTIFLDQDRHPIYISDDFIQQETAKNLCLSQKYQRQTTTTSIGQQIHFPEISPKRPFQTKKKSLISERFSTDVSLPLGCDIKKNQLPFMECKENIRQKKHMKCEQSESRCSSFRETPAFMGLDSNIFNDCKQTPPKGRSLSNRRQVEVIQKQIQMKQRYNITDRPAKKAGNKALYFARVKSQLQ